MDRLRGTNTGNLRLRITRRPVRRNPSSRPRDLLGRYRTTIGIRSPVGSLQETGDQEVLLTSINRVQGQRMPHRTRTYNPLPPRVATSRQLLHRSRPTADTRTLLGTPPLRILHSLPSRPRLSPPTHPNLRKPRKDGRPIYFTETWSSARDRTVKFVSLLAVSRKVIRQDGQGNERSLPVNA